MKRTALGLICAGFGCGSEDEARGGGLRVWECDETRAQELVDVGFPPSASGPAFVEATTGSVLGGFAVVPTTSDDGTEGAISLVDLRTFTVTPAFTDSSPDASVRHANGRLYVLNRSGADTVRAYDSNDDFRPIGAAFSVADEGEAAEPQDICCPTREECYVVRAADAEILIVNPEAGGKVLGKIDLSSAADPDPLPRACFLAGGRLVVAQEDTFTFLDLQVDPPAILSTLPTAARIPRGRFLHVSATQAMIAETGEEGVADGKLEQIDGTARMSESIPLTEEDLEGEMIGVAPCSGDQAWTVTAEADGHTSLRSVDFATASDPVLVRRPLYEADDNRLVAIGIDHLRRIWVADRDLE